MIKVVGIDWSTTETNRAVAVLEFNPDSGITKLCSLGSLALHDLFDHYPSADYAVVAVDVPFGWPKEFSEFVCRWKPKLPLSELRVPQQRAFRLRTTDRIVHDELKQPPLSVSTNFIGLLTDSWLEWCSRYHLSEHIDLGSEAGRPGNIIEVYPQATLKAFDNAGLLTDRKDRRNYKQHRDTRRELVEILCDKFGIEHQQQIEMLIGRDDDDDHLTDAFVAAITAWIYLRVGKSDLWTVRTPKDAHERNSAEAEGWIFFPSLTMLSSDA